MERIYVVTDNGRAAAGAEKMASSRALTPYNRFVASHAKPGRSMQEVAAMWRSSGAKRNPTGYPLPGAAYRPRLRSDISPQAAGSAAASAKARAERRWLHNPPGKILGMRLPAFLQDVNPLDVRNLKNVGALVGSAIVVVGAPMLAGRYNSGLAGLGLTVLAAGAATGGVAVFSPALAVPVGAMGLGIVVLRGLIYFVPRVVGWIVTPLLGWAGAAPPVASAAPAAPAAPGTPGSYANRLIEGYARKQMQPVWAKSPITGHVVSR